MMPYLRQYLNKCWKSARTIRIRGDQTNRRIIRGYGTMNEPKLKSYIVTEIEFDFDDGNDNESYGISYEEQIAMQDNVLVFGTPMMMNT